MQFIKIVREEIVGVSCYKMAQLLGLSSTQVYLDFERSKSKVSLKNLVALWEISGLSKDEFFTLVIQEVKGKE